MKIVRKHLRLIWADKIALWLAIICVAAMAALWLLVAVAAGLDGASHVVTKFGLDGIPQIALVIVSVWAFLRAIDFIAGGATYKMFMASPEVELVPAQPAITTPNKPMAAM
jgi:hypothetical protein